MSHRGGPDHGDVTSSWFAARAVGAAVTKVSSGSAGAWSDMPIWGDGALAPDRRGQGAPYPHGGMHEDADVKRETSEIPPSERSTGVMSQRAVYNRLNATLCRLWARSSCGPGPVASPACFRVSATVPGRRRGSAAVPAAAAASRTLPERSSVRPERPLQRDVGVVALQLGRLGDGTG